MESKNYSTIIILSILAFALIIAAATTAIPTLSFKNVLAQGRKYNWNVSRSNYWSRSIYYI